MPDSLVCNILLLNDDETPMDFVVWVQYFSDLDFDEASKLMLRIHNEGKAICGTCEREEAARRVSNILAFAAKHGHPLKCILEEPN
jgi:ATP-dependent Clp protease adaptor protein ClpS